MNFENSLKEGYVKRVGTNINRTKSLLKSSNQTIKTAMSIPLKEETIKSVFRELYEGLRQFCEAIGFARGFKFQSHEAISYFLRDILKENGISQKFDRYRILRNQINYYGDDISEETVKDALEEIPKIIASLKKYL